MACLLGNLHSRSTEGHRWVAERETRVACTHSVHVWRSPTRACTVAWDDKGPGPNSLVSGSLVQRRSIARAATTVISLNKALPFACQASRRRQRSEWQMTIIFPRRCCASATSGQHVLGRWTAAPGFSLSQPCIHPSSMRLHSQSISIL